MPMASAAPLVDIEEFEHSMFRSTPELYFGYHFAQGRNQLGNSEGFQPNKTVTYTESKNSDPDRFYLTGDWQNQKDGMELVSENRKHKTAVQRKGGKHCDCKQRGKLEILLDGQPLDSPYSRE